MSYQAPKTEKVFLLFRSLELLIGADGPKQSHPDATGLRSSMADGARRCCHSIRTVNTYDAKTSPDSSKRVICERRERRLGFWTSTNVNFTDVEIPAGRPH